MMLAGSSYPSIILHNIHYANYKYVCRSCHLHVECLMTEAKTPEPASEDQDLQRITRAVSATSS